MGQGSQHLAVSGVCTLLPSASLKQEGADAAIQDLCFFVFIYRVVLLTLRDHLLRERVPCEPKLPNRSCFSLLA